MSAKRKVAPPTAADEALRVLDMAFRDLTLAKDGAGLRVMIAPASPSAADCRAKLEEFIRFLHGSRFIQADGEIAFARNLGLLTNVWIAALNYESEVKKQS